MRRVALKAILIKRNAYQSSFNAVQRCRFYVQRVSQFGPYFCGAVLPHAGWNQYNWKEKHDAVNMF